MNFFELYAEEDSDHSEPQIEDKVNKKEPKIVNKIVDVIQKNSSKVLKYIKAIMRQI